MLLSQLAAQDSILGVPEELFLLMLPRLINGTAQKLYNVDQTYLALLDKIVFRLRTTRKIRELLAFVL